MSPYRKIGHRVSLLPLTQYCGRAGALSEVHGAGRPAAMSTAFHARQARDPRADTLFALLSDEEQREVSSWKPPVDVAMGDGIVLRYENADKEVVLGLDQFGWYANPEDEECLTIGHMDFGWVMIGADGVKTAYVADIKKSVWTTPDGPESLQLHAYAWAYAQMHGCQFYVTGLWIATEGEWLWSTEMVELASPRGQQIWERILAAALNLSDEYNSGAHCRGCYARLHCQEHAMPMVDPASVLAPLLSGAELTNEMATELKLKLDAIKELTKKADEQLEEMVRRGAVRIEKGGKRWVLIECKGRETIDREKLRSELGDRVAQFIKKGKPYLQPRWINA